MAMGASGGLPRPQREEAAVRRQQLVRPAGGARGVEHHAAPDGLQPVGERARDHHVRRQPGWRRPGRPPVPADQNAIASNGQAQARRSGQVVSADGLRPVLRVPVHGHRRGQHLALVPDDCESVPDRGDARPVQEAPVEADVRGRTELHLGGEGPRQPIERLEEQARPRRGIRPLPDRGETATAPGEVDGVLVGQQAHVPADRLPGGVEPLHEHAVAIEEAPDEQVLLARPQQRRVQLGAGLWSVEQQARCAEQLQPWRPRRSR